MKPLARLLLLLGAAALGLFLLRAAPRDVTLVYGVPDPGGVTGVEADVRRGGEFLRHAEFRFPTGAPGPIRHEVRLPDGEYAVSVRVSRRDGTARVTERPFAVSEGGPIVLPLDTAP